MFRQWMNKLMVKKYKRYKEFAESPGFVYDTDITEFMALYQELRTLDPDLPRLESIQKGKREEKEKGRKKKAEEKQLSVSENN